MNFQHNMKAFTRKYKVKRLLAFALFVGVCSGAWAQVTSDQYSTYSGASSTTKITHKAPKWTQYHQDSYNDTYNIADMDTLANGAIVQAANVYVDTIYVHKGTSVELTLPYRVSDSNASIYSYYRWFDYRTDGNFYCNTSSIGSGGTVYDLLTPAISGRTVYRFANGYVVQGAAQTTAMTKMNFYYPTDTEYNAISSGNFIKTDNNYYIVACDASIYSDFANNNGSAATFGSGNGWYEPTLAGRAIYYIVGVEDSGTDVPSAFEHYWALQNSSYQEGGNTVDDHYIDEYEITYPTRRFSANTAEMVALNKDANAYAIPGTSADDDPGYLDVTLIEEPELGFRLAFTEPYDGTADGVRTIIPTGYGQNGKISGNDRIMFFYKGTLGGLSSTTSKTTVPTDTQWYVANGSTLTVLVTKTVSGIKYNLARYKITFSDDANLLTQTQVHGLSKLTGDENYWWKDMTSRDSLYMANNYTQVASLMFDYDTSVNAQTILTNNAGQTPFYPFPMDWSSNGYAFYDGSTTGVNTNFDTATSKDGTSIKFGARFSMYSITNDYLSWWDSTGHTGANTDRPPEYEKNSDGYWLYIDASERPGTVAEITIDGNLCPGSKLFGTAWIKGSGGNNSVDAGALFSIGGVTVNNDGTETHTPILRQATGQVRSTGRITDEVNEPGLTSDITGKGEGTNEWFQVYFSFVSDENTYDYYTLRVDNYCAGTDGGDYCFDELKVYVLTPTVVMAELEPLCTTNDSIAGRSLIRMDLDYESMMARLGLEPSDYSNETDTLTASVDFVIINEAKYRNALAAGTDTETAFKDALVTFWGTGDDLSDGHIFPTLDFYCNYALNTAYNELDPGGNVVDFGVKHTDGSEDTDEAYFYYRFNENGAVELSMDCFTNMVAYTEYMILIEPHTETPKTSEQKLKEFIALIDDVCAISTEFYMSASITLKINGETADPTADYCAGQTLVISPEVSYTDDNGNVIYLDDVYFDWFFGSVEEYTAANDTYGGVSLYEALLNFRHSYPYAEELSETETPYDVGDFTKNDYNIIYHYLHTATDNYSNMLVLHMTHLSMRVLTTGIELVIQPIEIYFEGLDICFGYVPLTLYSSGDAPTLKSGFHNIDSPDGYDPCLRLGLAQLEKSSSTNPIVVNLCKATYVADANAAEGAVDHLGVGGSGMEYLYLVDTNDPVYHAYTLDPDFTQYDLPVGQIAHLYATNDDKSDNTSVSSHSYMQIYFFDDNKNPDPAGIGKAFTAKEGYYYVLDVHFEEETASGDSIGAVCYGILPLEIKVVPEYLVWTGNKSGNWNYDNHWRRADWTDIHMPDSTSYVTNYQNGTDRGYVPMLFTKVIIPKDSVAELYMSGFIANGTTHSDGSQMLSWVGDDTTSPSAHGDVSEEPTYNIMYDLMLYENPTSGALKTEHYRVNLCDEIHLAPGAQVLHSEQLIYNKAWTEVQLPQGPWTLQATPLRDVVSGDWYTKRATGTETAEYFKDITWSSDSTINYRYTPLLYQRSWGTSDKVILNNYTGTGASTTVPSYASTGWSSVYNDTSVPYQAGEGFSIKGNLSSYDGSISADSLLMFRFPKADTGYDLSSTTTAFDRTNANRFLISDLVTRTVDVPDNDDDEDIYYDEQGNENTVTVNLTQTGNGYYIIGNPFTAPMSTKEFMKENSQFLSYWTESTYGPIAGANVNGQPVSSWGTEDVLIEPYHAFFVTTDDTSEQTVTFTKDMQETTLETSETSPNRYVAFSVRAEGQVGTTGAALAYDDRAEDGYNVVEDVILMEDDAWSDDGMPVVYTVAGDMAVSVNWVNSMELVPMGVYAADDCVYTLTFVGTDKLNEPSLYDAYTNTDTPLTEGYSLSMTGATHGRYFIRSKGAATDISQVVNEEYSLSAYSPVERTVVVSSTAEIESVEVYSMSGVLQKKVGVGNSLACTIEGVSSGIAIVRAHTTEGTFVKKIMVR